MRYSCCTKEFRKRILHQVSINFRFAATRFRMLSLGCNVKTCNADVKSTHFRALCLSRSDYLKRPSSLRGSCSKIQYSARVLATARMFDNDPSVPSAIKVGFEFACKALEPTSALCALFAVDDATGTLTLLPRFHCIFINARLPSLCISSNSTKAFAVDYRLGVKQTK